MPTAKTPTVNIQYKHAHSPNTYSQHAVSMSTARTPTGGLPEDDKHNIYLQVQSRTPLALQDNDFCQHAPKESDQNLLTLVKISHVCSLDNEAEEPASLTDILAHDPQSC